MIQKIMVATGGSPWSEEAVKYAARLVKLLNAQLYVVTVVEYPTLFSQLVASAPFKEELKKHGEEILKRAAEIAENEGVTCEKILLEGPIPENVVAAAVDKNIDLLVIGSRSKKGLFREAIGSIANKIAAMAPCPVLIVKDTSYIEDLLRKGIITR